MVKIKCGIEIHQQLNRKKLFCNCPTLIREEEPLFTISRKLQASAGESGRVDITAAYEQAKGKNFSYQGYTDSNCLVETDSEPPHEINRDALATTLQFSKVVKARISPVIQVMRKIVVDGSNTSGFQRTALIARDGLLKTSKGNVKIENISLEEDAARIISETAEERIYRLDRLGVPLIEISTAPEITSPDHCLEVAQKLGLMLRSLPGIKRGLGTIRQDVNISIDGGERIEIKGVQDLKQLPLLVELEVKRQQELLKIKKELTTTKLLKKDKIKVINLTSLLGKSTSKIIVNTLHQKGKILVLKLTGLAGLLGKELQPGKRFGSECSEWAKAKAGVGGIFHSDELPNYGITFEEVTLIKAELECQDQDAFVLVADQERKARLALEAVYERILEAKKGVPKEVRKANTDATTSFLRPLPGSARMYPETDVPLIIPDPKNIILPELLEEKIARYQKNLSLGKDLAVYIAKSPFRGLFEEISSKYPRIKPAFIAETLSSTLLEIKRKYQLNPEVLTENHFRELFSALDQDKIHKDIVLDVLIDMIKGNFSLEKYASVSTEDLHQKLKKIVENNKDAPFPALMGLAMRKLAGQASGKIISEELRKILVEGHK